MYKHVGRIKGTTKKVVVAYRTLPNDATSCLVVKTESLDAAEHDSLINLVESNVGQTAEEFADAMNRSFLTDGRNMLHRFHATGKLEKISTSHIEMTPDMKSILALDKLNEILAQQKGVSVEDLAVKNPNAVKQDEPTVTQKQEALSDDDIAAQYRSQADTMFKEAKRLREQAEELSPTKKKQKNTDEVKA